MSSCNPCLAACSVPLCTAEIIIGNISAISTDVIIIIENKGTGRKSYVSTRSDGAGVVTMVTTGLGLMANQSYEISVILKTATALCNRETLTIGTSTTSCVTVLFENVLGNGGCQVAFESQTLTVPENTQPGTNCLCVTQAMLDAIGGGKILSGTYAQTVAALTAGVDLNIYSAVLITDFQTIYDQPDFDNTGTAKTPVTKTSSVTEPLLIGLLDANTLKPEAYSALYPKDQIRYDITFNATEVNGTAAKGRITERIDHLNNRTDYDHRHILFKRYESAPASGIFNQYKDNGGTSQEFTTFQFAAETPVTGFSNNNYIGDYAILFSLYSNPFILSNNVFGKNAEDNKTPNYTQNNTWGENCTANVFTTDVSNSIFGNSSSNNHIGAVYDSVFGSQFNLNTFTGQVISTTFGNDCNTNGGGSIINCVFGTTCIYNDFGQSINTLIFGNGLTQNHFKNTATGVDFTLATHVYATYNCDIFYNQAAVLKLFYFDAADTMIVVNATA